MNVDFIKFRARVVDELNTNILPFWMKHTKDHEKGGFFGRIINDMVVQNNAVKGLILNSRILWTFSAAYRFDQNPECLKGAERAYQYLIDYFWDTDYGGMYWLLDANGKPVDVRKKIYGQAFAIFGLTEYYAASGNHNALNLAIQLYHLIEHYNYDSTYKGYYEASNRDWSLADDLRLSEVDMNEIKSMNTHLHMLEAYTNLCLVCKDKEPKEKLLELINDFLEFIIDTETHHFHLFFNEKWEPKSKNYSFGHDIEGSWLLCKAIEVLEDDTLASRVHDAAHQAVQATLNEGVDEEGGVYYERRDDGSLDTDVHWWVQAEAVVGLINGYQYTGRDELMQAAWRGWEFIEKYLIDKENGEWFYKVNQERQSDPSMYKVSEWKGPYHNGRACMEIIRRLNELNA
jgi:mannobiose 2-epimerase